MLERYKKRWSTYFNKENFDHTQGEVDPFEYHSCFLVFAKLFSVMDYEKLPFWMYISPVSVAISGFVAVCIFSMSMSHFIRNMQIHLMAECATYALIMVYKLLIISCTFTGKKYYHSLMRALRDDFHYICTKGLKYREGFFENQRLTFKTCVVAAIFTGFIGSGMTLWACLSVFLVYLKKDEDLVRPLPFPFWVLNYDLHATPTYEIYFALSVLFTFCHTYAYIFMMQTQILWIREVMCKADIVRWSIQDLLVDFQPANSKEEEDYYSLLIRDRMRSIILMHQSMFKLLEDYAAVYKKCLLYEQKLAAPIICMTSYCFAEKADAGEFQGILLLLCCAVIVLVFIPSYLCTALLEKVQSISDSCWETPFWNAGPVIRPYLVLIMQRSMRPLPIVAAGFEDISLQTYSSILSRAYSCFNMLRQAF